jgi:hypothetical protein
VANEFDREPCFWTSNSPGYNTNDRQRTFMKNGVKVTERHPQRGHAGDYENRLKAAGTRYIRLVDHHGHEIFHVLTNAAAHLDHTAPYGQYALAKARYLGWFMPGQCPCALLATGEMKRHHFVDQSLVGQAPCDPKSCSYENQCKHSLAERAARMAVTQAAHVKREQIMKGDATLNLEATQAMTKTVTEAVTKLVEIQTAEKKGKTEK